MTPQISQEIFSQILAFIRQGDWQKAEEELRKLDRSDFEINRMVVYFEGKKLLVLHQYEQAIQIFNEAREQFGEHLLLLADLATAYYLTQRYGLWKNVLDRILMSFNLEAMFYGEPIRDRLRILIAKFLEESGDLATAEKYLVATLESSHPSMVRRAQTHLLRLWGQYRMSDKTLELYRDLKAVNPPKEDPEYHFEHCHAIALAEAELSTPELAVKSLLGIKGLDPISMNLIVFDLAEIEYRRTSQVSEIFYQHLNELSPSHLYEEKLLALFRGENLIDWYQWAAQMPIGNYLRLLSLLMASPSFREQELALHQWKLLIATLTKKNQNLWNKLLPDPKKLVSEPRVQLTTDGVLLINQIAIDLSTKPLLVEFVKILLRHQSIKDEIVCRELWQTDPSDSYLARLRQLTNRINKLALKSAAPQICTYSQGTLQIHGRI